ncbi:MAG: Gfo/Idh/MocA family oxidoreductase [Thermoplasmata archaeon]|nr:MAG: Gfo/Idh/MocA family oxidoreductase [Thermoplasmata archaeon]
MLNVGVIGVGMMGQNHARVYSEIANLVGIADPDEKKLNEISKRFQVKGYKLFNDLLERKDLEAVSVSSPTSTHFEIAKAAIEAKKHVLIEKPMGGSLKEAMELVANAKRKGVVLAVGFIERHNPVVGFTKNLIERRQFGDVISVSSRRVSSIPLRVKDVGVILDLGIHDIDVIRYLLGSKVKSVFALASNIGETDFEDHANILFEFENGVFAFTEVNWLTPMKVRKVSLTCSKNFVEMDYIKQTLQISSSTIKKIDTSNLYRIPQEYEEKKVEIERREPLKNELSDFLEAIEHGRNPLVSGEEGVRTLEIAHAAMLSAEKGKKVSI